MTLEELSEVDAGVFVAESVSAFVADLVESGVDRDVAAAATDDYMGRLLPEGVRTDGHRFRGIEEAGRRVGRLWFGPIRESPGDCYLFEIDIEQEERGQGLGRMALELVISELQRSTFDRLGLNVFDSNAAARALYESLGFEDGGHSDGGSEMWLPLAAPR